MTQPEALRLADDLAKYLGGNTATQAAAELRRLAEENEAIKAERDEDRRREYGYSQQVVDALTKERDIAGSQRTALLEALRRHVELHDGDCICKDCAAIAKAEENT